MKKPRKLKKDNVSVSEVLATILLLGAAVLIFSSLYAMVFSYPFEADEPTPVIIAFVEGDNIILEHRGGEELGLNSKINLRIGDSIIYSTVEELLIDLNGDGKWNIGEKLAYAYNFSLDVSEADLTSIDVNGNRIVLQGILDVFPESDIGIEVFFDNESPIVYDTVNITIKVTHYRGDINATGIKIKYKLPDGLEYVNHNPASYNYNNDTGIWLVNDLEIRQSSSITIKAKVTATGSLAGPTQMALVLDGSNSITDENWEITRTGISNVIENPDLFYHGGLVELTIVQIGGNLWRMYWDDSSPWIQKGYSHSGDYSIFSDQNNEGNLISNDIDTSKSSEIKIEFWYRRTPINNDDFRLYYYDGSSYNLRKNLGGSSTGGWAYFSDTITDQKYFIDDFKIRFYTNFDMFGMVWIDDIIISDDTDIYLHSEFETIGYAQTEIGPTLVTNIPGDPGYFQDITDQIRVMGQLKGSTPMGCGIRLAADRIFNSEIFDYDKRQIIFLITDGQPNCQWVPNTYTGYFKDDISIGKRSAEKARNDLKGLFEMPNDQDEFNALAIGEVPDIPWLIDDIVSPQPGYQAPPFDQGPGWVMKINSYTDFEDAISQMFSIIFKGIKNTIEIVGLDSRDPNPKNNIVEIIIVPKVS